MTNKHTKGPWVTRLDCKVVSPNEHREGGFIADCFTYDCNERERQANAQLIAAAPELLEACLRLLDHALFSSWNWHSMADHHRLELVDRIKAAQKAIDKARGV